MVLITVFKMQWRTGGMNKIKKSVKNFLTWFYVKHSTIYTILILLLGIILGCLYDGQGEDGTHYFHIFGHTIYIGFIL